MPSKTGEQVLLDCHDDAANALRTTGAGGLPPVTTVLRETSTGAGPVAFTSAFAKKIRIRSISGHANAAVAEALTITLDSLTGAAFDALLQTVAAGWTDFLWQPDAGDLILEAGDEITLACANTGLATFGIEIIAEEAN